MGWDDRQMLLLGLLYLTTWVALVYTVHRRPEFIFRPSVWFSALFQLVVAGSAVFTDDSYRYIRFWAPLSYLRYLDQFRLAAVLLPLVCLAIAMLSPSVGKNVTHLVKTMRRGDGRSGWGGVWNPRGDQLVLGFLLLAGVVIVGFYLQVVPLRTTGLWTLLFDRGHADLARANSMAPADWPLVTRYGYGVLWKSVLAPVCCCLLLLSPFARLLRLAGLLLVMVSVTLPGEKSPVAVCILTMASGYLLLKGVRRALPLAAGGFVLIVMIGTAMSLAKSRGISEMDFKTIIQFAGLSLERFFVSPFTTGVYTAIFAQDHGLLGVSNIRPLATLAGEAYFPLSHAAGWYLSGMAPLPPNMNTCFLFDFQSSFGIWAGFGVAVLAVHILDILPLAYLRLSPACAVAMYAGQLTSIVALLSSGFFTSLLTHGIGVTGACALIVHGLSLTATGLARKAVR